MRHSLQAAACSDSSLTACSPMRPSPQLPASQVSSVDYLTQPREVFAEVHRVLYSEPKPEP